jgi:catechol 2,3-dioxygenase-like lactoylglutathione lyase family enzyme
MARIQHLAIASLEPEKQAEFYKEVFGFKEIRRIDNPRARGVVLTDGAINISVLKFMQDQIDRGLDYTGLHHFGVYVEDLEGTANDAAHTLPTRVARPSSSPISEKPSRSAGDVLSRKPASVDNNPRVAD